MKAAVLHEVNKPLVIEDVSLPKPGPREVLIRTRVAGLCHSDLHARLDDSANVPQAWRDRLRDLVDRAVGFAREVAGRTDNEAEARRATSLLYHVASAVTLAWEGARIHAMRGDARRLLLSRLVVDHRIAAQDAFRLTENAAQRAMADHLLGDRPAGMVEVGELLTAA